MSGHPGISVGLDDGQFDGYSVDLSDKLGAGVAPVDGVLDGSDVEGLPNGRRLGGIDNGAIIKADTFTDMGAHVEGGTFVDMVAISLVVF